MIRLKIVVVAVPVFLILLLGCSVVVYKKSDHFDGTHFFNLEKSPEKNFWQFFKWRLSGNRTKWPEKRVNSVEAKTATNLKSNQISTTFINHATHLIQIKDFNFITDPVFSKRVSPLSFIGPKRVRPPAIALEKLPPIDVVLISHNHYDHMDKQSIKSLAKIHNPVFIVPLGNAELVKSMGAKKVIELDWWQKTQLPNSDISITLVPSQHWSKRGLFDNNLALWGGFVIQSKSFKIYFSGDTGYGTFFKKIRQRVGAIDLSILPIGAYEPRWLMKGSHINPMEAVLAHIDLESKMTIGSHFGTFQLTDEGIDEPIERLGEALEEMNIAKDKFIAPKYGQTNLISTK